MATKTVFERVLLRINDFWKPRRMNFTMSSKIEAVLIDLSGTIHIDDSEIQGSKEALSRLRASKLKVKFVTNTTKEPLRTLHHKLSSLGFHIDKREIFTSLTAARALVESKNVRPMLLLEESAKEDFSGIDTSDPDAVVVGLAPNCFNYQTMNEAFRLILDGAPLIAIHKARYYKKPDGKLHLGPGAFVSGLEYSTDTKAEVVGKPEKTFFLEALNDFDVKPENAVMIGDDARDDVAGAIKAGMMGILVQTGKYRPGDESKVAPQPTWTCPNFRSAVDLILKEIGAQ